MKSNRILDHKIKQVNIYIKSGLGKM